MRITAKIARLVRGARGSVAVEFALFTPFFLMLLFGVVELGGAWFQRQMLVSASREGARLGSLLNDAENSAAKVEQTVRNYLTQAGYPGQLSVVTSGTDGATGTQVRVTVTSPYRFPVLGSLVPDQLASVTLRAVTIMRHE